MCLCAWLSLFVPIYQIYLLLFPQHKLRNTSTNNSPPKQLPCTEEINSLLQINSACSFYSRIFYQLLNEVRKQFITHRLTVVWYNSDRVWWSLGCISNLVERKEMSSLMFPLLHFTFISGWWLFFATLNGASKKKNRTKSTFLETQGFVSSLVSSANWRLFLPGCIFTGLFTQSVFWMEIPLFHLHRTRIFLCVLFFLLEHMVLHHFCLPFVKWWRARLWQ